MLNLSHDLYCNCQLDVKYIQCRIQDFPYGGLPNPKGGIPTYYYRPQRSCGQGYVFTRVCDSVHRGGGGLPQCMLGDPPEGGTPGKEAPQKKAPPWEGDPLEGDPPPQEGGPREGDPPEGDPLPPLEGGLPPRRRPPKGGPPRRRSLPGIRSMSGRYASYWNAFLFWPIFPKS